MLSDDDTDLVNLSEEELDRAWDLWFDLAQATNDSDPLFTHGALAYAEFAVEDENAAQDVRVAKRADGSA